MGELEARVGRYPRSYLLFAIVTFHVFAFAFGFLVTAGFPGLGRLASFGVLSSATMWWVVDGMHRKRELPFASLWVFYMLWLLWLPIYYYRTRGRAGLKKLALHTCIATATFCTGAYGGYSLAW